MSESNGQQNHSEIVSTPISSMYQEYFLDYASYVILERAVPMLDDGLKPVQRRIMHAMKEMDDGRFHKVANIIGQTMQFHPHGDAAIGDALVKLGQKNLLVDCQGNWGDTRTGDRAAAARYIEGRLTKFALDVVFNPKTTEWQTSYDGRKKEPVTLPVKFPLILAQGVEGIAVGLSTKIMPHNFIELIKASIAVLKGKKPKLIPDFPSGGLLDASNYHAGKRGGKIRCRANIETIDKSSLKVIDLPYGTTTNSVIDSIVKANDKNKIKIKRVIDNTAQEVEILIELPTGVSPDITIDALYAFTDCEVSISPNACVIIDETPHFLSVEELLQISTENTRTLLQKELEIRLAELREKMLFSSLEKIFIENRIYRDIEECETWESVLGTIDEGLEPFKPQFYREITQEDITRLTEIKIKRISKFDSFKADELIRKMEEDIKQTEHHLSHLTEYAINYFEDLLKKYGAGRERKTQIANFDNIEVRQVAVANEKLYANLKEGFVGYNLKKEEFICECSDIDDVIIFRKDGKYMVSRVQEKAFLGKNILHVDVWKKGNDRKVYHAVYADPDSGKNYAKRFAVTAITRDREYDVTNGAKGAKLIYFSVHKNSEAEQIHIQLTQNCRAKKKEFDFDFGEMAIKGRTSQGNVVTKYPIRKVVQKSVGSSTLGGRKVWYDESVGRLNTDERGQYLGKFDTEDQILLVYKDGSYELSNFELSNRYDAKKLEIIERFNPETILTVVHYHGQHKDYYVKRFQIETRTTGKKFSFISDTAASRLVFASTLPTPYVQYKVVLKGRKKEEAQLNLAKQIEVKGWKSLGNKLDRRKITAVKELLVEQAAEETIENNIPEKLKAGDQVEWTKDELSGDEQGSLF